MKCVIFWIRFHVSLIYCLFRDMNSSETDSTCFQIPGYTLVNDNRTFSTGGGVALYVSLGYSFAIRNDLKIYSIENLWIETNDMIVGVIYKPPNFSNT